MVALADWISKSFSSSWRNFPALHHWVCKPRFLLAVSRICRRNCPRLKLLQMEDLLTYLDQSYCTSRNMDKSMQENNDFPDSSILIRSRSAISRLEFWLGHIWTIIGLVNCLMLTYYWLGAFLQWNSQSENSTLLDSYYILVLSMLVYMYAELYTRSIVLWIVKSLLCVLVLSTWSLLCDGQLHG